MRPQNRSPTIHLRLQHAELQLALAALDALQVGLEGVHAVVDLPVLAQQLGGVAPGLELGHLGCEQGENVLFFDAVVRRQVRAELQSGRQELLEGQVLRSSVRFARRVEERPLLSEVVVLVVPLAFVLWRENGAEGTYEILHVL